jgi:hypothetical protein
MGCPAGTLALATRTVLPLIFVDWLLNLFMDLRLQGLGVVLVGICPSRVWGSTARRPQEIPR